MRRETPLQVMATEKSNQKIRHDIQGLRAIAVLAVIIFHTNKDWLPGGFVGVDIFFVISGFLITSIIFHKKQSNTFIFKSFYQSRIKRIVPAYLFLLVIVAICLAIPLTTQDFGFFKDSLIKSLYFASNHYFARFGDYFAPNAHELPLLHLWSLAVEMQFYLLLPALLIFSPTKYLKTIVSILIAALTLYACYQLTIETQQQKAYFSLITRIPEFLIGSFLALSPQKKSMSTEVSNSISGLGLALIFSSFFLINESTSFPGLWALPPCLGTAMLIATHHSHINRVISCAPIVWIGGLSYSLYLWHWPILSTIRYCTQSYELSFPLIILFSLLTFSFAYISYRWIESPSRKKNHQNRKAIPKKLAVLIIFSAALISTEQLNESFLKPLPLALTRYADMDTICHGKMLDDCIQGDESSKKSILFLGDSHAAQLNIFADVIGKANHLNFQVITASSCVTIPNFDLQRLPAWAQQACSEQINQASNLIETTDNIVLAGMWEYQTNSEDFMEILNTFFQDADKRNQRVTVLAQIPMLGSNVQRIHRFEQLGLTPKIETNNRWKEANLKISALTNKYSSISFLDLSSHPFFENAPYYNGQLIYFDKSHLNEVGSELYGRAAAPFLKEALTFLNP